MAITDSDTLNYRGELFAVGNQSAPFLASIAGNAKRTAAFTFPIAIPYSPSSASQDTQSEDTAATAGTANTITLSQSTNVCQIMKYEVGSTFKKEATSGVFSGLNVDGFPAALSGLALQKKIGLMQIAKNIEYSFLQGAYTAESSSATNTTTRGLKNAIVTNTVAGGSSALDTPALEELIRKMIASGSPFMNPAILVNSFQMQKLSKIYGYAPLDRSVGGVNIQSVILPGGPGPIVVLFSPQMPADELYIVDRAFCAPVFCPVPAQAGDILLGQPINYMQNGVDVAYYPEGLTAAKVGGFLYTQIGFDYGPEAYHGSITGLATS